MATSSDMVAESSIRFITGVNESVLIEALGVVFLETAPVDQIETGVTQWRHVFEFSARPASASCAVRDNVKILVVTRRSEEEAALFDSAPAHALVLAAEESPHGLALPLVCRADTPADNAFAIEEELEEDVFGLRFGRCEGCWLDGIRDPELRREVGRNVDVDDSLVMAASCWHNSLWDHVRVELRLENEGDAVNAGHFMGVHVSCVLYLALVRATGRSCKTPGLFVFVVVALLRVCCFGR